MGLDNFSTDNGSKSKSKKSRSTGPPKKKVKSKNNIRHDIDVEEVDKTKWDMIISHPKDPRYEVDGIEHLSNVLITFDTEKHPSGISHNATLDEDEYINIEENKSQYNPEKMTGENTVNIQKADFDLVLQNTGLDFQEVDYSWANEFVYEATTAGGMFALRVYSTICQQQRESRGTGEDSIKINVVHNDTGKPLFTATRTYRTPGWDERLLDKIQDLIDKKSEITKCDKCGSIMVIRENNENGNEFYGCTQWPDCKNTKPVQ